jgi:predicted exporter
MMRRGAWLWLLAILLTAAYLVFRIATGITLESSILALLPRAERDAAAQSVQDRIAESFSRRVVFLVGDAAPAKAADAARKLSAALERSGLIASLTSKIDPDSQRRMGAAYFPYRAGLLSASDRANLLKGDGQAVMTRALSILYGAGGFANAKLIAHDPFLLMPAFFLELPVPKSKFTLENGVLSVRDGGLTYVLVSADLAGDPFAIKYQQAFDAVVSKTLSDLTAATPSLKIVRTGAVFYAHDSTREATQETSIIGLASTVGTLALIFLIFRGLRPILLGALAIGTGVLFALAGTLVLFGQIHSVALLLGVSLIGISVDYSFQYFCEYFDPAATGPDERLKRVLPGIAVGLATTLIGYCTLLLAPFPGLRQVAAISLIGLVGSVLTVVLWYPLLDSRRGSEPDNRFVALASKHWTLWEAPSLQGARLAIVGFCIVAAAAGMLFLRSDDDVRHLQSLSSELKRQESQIEKLTGSSSGTQFILLRGASEEALLQEEERLAPRLAGAERDGALEGHTAIAQFVPSIARQKENRALVRDRLVKPHLAGYLAQIGFQNAIESGENARYLTPSNLPRTGPLSLLPLLDVTVSGHPAHVILLSGVHDSEAVTDLVAGVPGARVVSLADDWSRLFGTFRKYAVGLLGLSALLMYPLLWWRYGWLGGLRVLAPSLAAVALTPPLAALAGITFTFFNAMALVLVLSVGVDYSVFCRETSGTRKPVTSLAIALAALSTILSFGMLALSRVFAVHAFGTTMLIGITLAFLFAPAAVPARSSA